MYFFFFFSSRRRHTRWPRDWSSDVCSSDLYEDIGIDGAARSAQFSQITEEDGSWRVRQILADPDEHHDWAITAEIDLKASDAAQEPVVRIVEVGPWQDRKSTRLNSSHVARSYAVYC